MKKITALLLSSLILTTASLAQDQFVRMDKMKYNQGDTLTISCGLPVYKTDSIHFATLYLFIENMASKRRWTYRYPIVDGISAASLIIDSSLPNGSYAFNFLVRKRFFSMQGSAANLPSSQLNYSMLTKNNNSFFDKVQTDEAGKFSLKGILYEDTCYFIFSAPKSNKPNDLNISIRTPLDSAFTSDTSEVQFVYLGHTDTLSKATEAAYQTDLQTFFQLGTTLPGVTVTATQKKRIELFNDEYSTGLFKNGNATIFDGIENNNIAESGDVMEFLKGRVAGLRVMPGNSGNYILQWQGPSSFRGGSNVDVFLDEFRLDRITPGFIHPSEVAMIKAYPPPAFLSAGGQRGAIAIYTKRDGAGNTGLSKNKYKVFGYTALETVWK